MLRRNKLASLKVRMASLNTKKAYRDDDDDDVGAFFIMPHLEMIHKHLEHFVERYAHDRYRYHRAYPSGTFDVIVYDEHTGEHNKELVTVKFHLSQKEEDEILIQYSAYIDDGQFNFDDSLEADTVVRESEGPIQIAIHESIEHFVEYTLDHWLHQFHLTVHED